LEPPHISHGKVRDYYNIVGGAVVIVVGLKVVVDGRVGEWGWWVVRGVWVTANNLYCIPTYVGWCFLLQPLRLLAPSAYFAMEGTLFKWLLTMVAFWSHSAGYRSK
jgi:hypothetical protein